ncbi:GDSL-type esterase/lipase family protein [Algiphilus sp.]|uniref:GDSL-type esterase/lipase family protein n=1 Tax=Algiphilus sp. TaxID=1872431 RepID=UPI003B5193AE
MVTSWRTAPGDALITHPITGLSVRQSFAPHWAGEVVRLRLSNRYSSVPLTLENVHLALEAEAGGAAMVPGSACPLTFDGGRRITLAAGETAVSDPIHFPVRPFQRVGVSFFAPEVTLQITRHLNANEHLYISIPGDHAADATGAAFLQVPDGYASNFLAIEALEVAAPRAVRTLVAVGDSITDGSGSAIAIPDGTPAAMTATDQRYPNHLQRRLLTAGLPLTVANAGIGGNELLGPGLLPQFGRGLIDRFDADVLSVTGATHVLVMIGTNDSGNALPGQVPSAEAMIAGYTQLIERAHEAGLKIILGTIPPAEGTVIDGLPVVGRLGLPIGIMHGTAEARQSRDAINAWIRAQTLSDGIVDFDACLEDPLRPGYLAPEYNSGDNLHPNPAGYRAMADCVDLDLLR